MALIFVFKCDFSASAFISFMPVVILMAFYRLCCFSTVYYFLLVVTSITFRGSSDPRYVLQVHTAVQHILVGSVYMVYSIYIIFYII